MLLSLKVFSHPFPFSPRVLPLFYQSLLLAWQNLNGSFSSSRNSLVYGSSLCHVCLSVSNMCTKICCLYLLSENMVPPCCVAKFAPAFRDLHWSTTWQSLSFFDVDHQVIDLNWKIAQGILYAAQCLVCFGLCVPLSCFCGLPVESLEHLFFSCPLAQCVLSWLQSLMFNFLTCARLSCVVMLVLVLALMSCVSPLVFSFISSMFANLLFDFRFRDVRPAAKTCVKFNLPLFFWRFKSSHHQCYFHCQWGTRGVVASVSAGQLSLNI